MHLSVHPSARVTESDEASGRGGQGTRVYDFRMEPTRFALGMLRPCPHQSSAPRRARARAKRARSATSNVRANEPLCWWDIYMRCGTRDAVEGETEPPWISSSRKERERERARWRDNGGGGRHSLAFYLFCCERRKSWNPICATICLQLRYFGVTRVIFPRRGQAVCSPTSRILSILE